MTTRTPRPARRHAARSGAGHLERSGGQGRAGRPAPLPSELGQRRGLNPRERNCMQALVYHGPKKVSVDEVPDARIERPTDALIRVTTTNICGSDLHMYER